MLVDDSAVIRKVVANVLREVPGLEVVGTATNGQEALDRIGVLHPHVVVLDVEMPVLDGLATLRQLRPKWPSLPVIMFSTLTSRAAAATLDALSNGANDYAAKPTTLGSVDQAIEAVRHDLVPLVRDWGAIGKRREPTRRLRLAGPTGLANAPAKTAPATLRPGAAPAAPTLGRPTAGLAAGAGTPAQMVKATAPTRMPRGRTAPIAAVVIGSSAGGPNALAELIPQFPADFPVPMLLTQHMPETFTALLAARLNERSRLTVLEAAPGTEIKPGHLYIAKGGTHLVMTRNAGRVVLDFDGGPPENFCRPAVDVMFRSAARLWGPALLGLVLTGMGRDGVDGARHIVDKGGSVLTQDEDSCLVWGMPGAVVEAGLSSEEIPLNRIAATVCDRLKAAGVAR